MPKDRQVSIKIEVPADIVEEIELRLMKIKSKHSIQDFINGAVKTWILANPSRYKAESPTGMHTAIRTKFGVHYFPVEEEEE